MKNIISFIYRFKIIIAVVLFLAITTVISFSMYSSELNKNKELQSLLLEQKDTNNTDDGETSVTVDDTQEKDNEANNSQENENGEGTDFTEQLEVETVVKNYVKVYYNENSSISKDDRISEYKTLVTKDMYEMNKEDLGVAFFTSSITDTKVTNVDVYFGKFYSNEATAFAVIDRKVTNEEDGTYIEDKVYEKYQLKYEDEEWLISEIII